MEFTPCRCSLCGEQLSEKKVLHTRTWLHLSALFSQMVTLSDEHSSHYECSLTIWSAACKRTSPVTVCAVGWFCREQPLDRTLVECSGDTPLSNDPMESWQAALNTQGEREHPLLTIIKCLDIRNTRDIFTAQLHLLFHRKAPRESRRVSRSVRGPGATCVSQEKGSMGMGKGSPDEFASVRTSLDYMIREFLVTAAVHCCRVKEPWSDTHVELDLRPHMVTAVAQEGAESLYGQTPRGSLERKALGVYCLALCVVRGCWRMMRHSITWLYLFAHLSHVMPRFR